MKKYSNTIIDATQSYLTKLMYNADNNSKLLDALYSLQILNFMLDWSFMFDFVTEQDRQGLMALMNQIITKNKGIGLPYSDDRSEIGTNTEYKNVNFPQTYMTWDLFTSENNFNKPE